MNIHQMCKAYLAEQRELLAANSPDALASAFNYGMAIGAVEFNPC